MPSSRSRGLPTALALLLSTILPLNGETIYAVVFGNQKLLVGSSTLSSGLFRSSDDGTTWTHLGVPNLKAFSMDADDAEQGELLYVAAGNGIHRSTDAGKTWRIVTDWRLTEVLDVRVDPRDHNTIWAATAWGLWRSSDRGDQWRFVPLESRRLPARMGMVYCYRFAVDGSRLLLLTDSTVIDLPLRGRPRVRQRIPSPRAWAGTTYGPAIAAHPFYLRDLLLPPPPHANTYDVLVDSSSNPRRLVLAGDSGVCAVRLASDPHWSDLSAGLPVRIVHALVLTGKGSLVAGTWGDGIWRYRQGAWELSGLEGCQIWRMVVKPW